jgi:hypothetical protein
MRTLMLVSTLCLSAYAAAAQQPTAKPHARRHAASGMMPANVKGTWTIENTVQTAAGTDTVVNSELVATATRKGWMTNLAGRKPIPTRVVATGGDSVVTMAGPFASVVRAGLKVRTRETLHFNGDSLSGTMEARYSNGQVAKGTVRGARKM